LFYDVKLVQPMLDGKQCPAIAGRFVKDTKLRRKRIYDPERGLVMSDVTMDSAPVSFFVLVLQGHRLLYVREDPGAPGLDIFEATIRRFLVDSWEEYIDRMHRSDMPENAQEKPRPTKKQLERETPKPSLEIIQIATERSLGEFVEDLDNLRSAKLGLVQTNDETDNDVFIEAFRNMKDRAKSKTSTIQHSNPQGLDKKEIIEQFKPAALTGNAKIVLKGTTEDGQEISGDNKNFKLKIGLDVENLDGDVPTIAKELLEAYQHTIAKGDIPAPVVPEGSVRKIEAAAYLFTD
jgi:hypothetical protein